MELIGKKFGITRENVMTVTSMNDTAYESWEIVEQIDESIVKCELKSTNASMYSGSGYFREFNINDIKIKD